MGACIVMPDTTWQKWIKSTWHLWEAVKPFIYPYIYIYGAVCLADWTPFIATYLNRQDIDIPSNEIDETYIDGSVQVCGISNAYKLCIHTYALLQRYIFYQSTLILFTSKSEMPKLKSCGHGDICISLSVNLVYGSGNGLLPTGHQAIIQTNWTFESKPEGFFSYQDTFFFHQPIEAERRIYASVN